MVSIIIPVFNAEKYIHRCIDSILSQTYTDIEVLLIDDGSQDNCGIICDQYAEKDKRIKVFHQQNRGVSFARQKGLDKANGEYIIHVDPDDWIEKEEIEGLYYKAITENADMVIFDYWYETNNEKRIICERPTTLDAASVRRQILCQQIHGSCCNKLISKKIIDAIGCGFHPLNISYCEDILFNIRLLLHNIRITYLPKAYYHYNLSNPSSVTKSFSKKKLYAWMDAIEELSNILPKEDIPYLYAQKKDVLYVAFRLKRFDIIKNTYKDIHNQIILNSGRYSWRTPISSNLSLAIKGYPVIAFLLFHIQINLINFIRIIKHKTTAKFYL